MKHNQRHRLGLMIAAVMCSLPVTAAEMVSVSDSAVLEQALSVQARSLAPVENGFEAVKTIQLPNGKTKVRYQQTYLGLPVFDTAVVATEGRSGLSNVHGTMAQGLAADLPSVSVNLDQQQAIALGKQRHQAKHANAKALNTENETAQLMVRLDANNKAQLVYLVSFFVAEEEPSRPFMFIDANSGEILQVWDGLNHAQAGGTGPGGNSKTGRYEFGTDYPSFVIDKVGTTCTMENSVVKTVDLQNRTSGSTAYSYSCPGASNYN
ncbi:PepSY domain-containing protein, partial [Vibrio vulnificus]